MTKKRGRKHGRLLWVMGPFRTPSQARKAKSTRGRGGVRKVSRWGKKSKRYYASFYSRVKKR